MWKPFNKAEEVEVKRSATTGDNWVSVTGGNRTTSSGQCINNANALAISTVYDCIRIISEDLAKLPLPVFQQVGGIKEKRNDHTLYNVLNWQPNPEMSAMSFRNTIIGHAVGWGNGYAEKVRDQNGDVIELWIIPPDRIKPMRDQSGNLYYEFREENGNLTKVDPEKILHIPGFGYDGVQGYNVVQIARESLGLAAAAEMFGSKFFGNGAKASMVMTFPNSLTENARINLKKSASEQVSGRNQHRILLVEEGGDIKSLSLSQKDSQYLETRGFSVTEICRWFRMPPHKVADLSKATFSNIEEQNIDFVSDTLMPWFIRVEQAIHNQCLTETDQDAGYYVKHNANALLRGNSKSRSEFYASAIQNGWMTRNEARGFEDLNPLEGLDDPLVPLNMSVVGEEPEETTTGNDAFVEDVAGRIALAEERGLSARVDKADEDRERFNEWSYGFYHKHISYIGACIKPLVNAGNIQGIAHSIVCSGLSSVMASKNPAEHIKTWNRKQEITDIINEALTCTTK